MKKQFLFTITAMALSAMMAVPAMAAWQKDDKGWWYQNADQSYPAGAWQEIGGVWYYFDGTGYMAADQWIETYYVGTDGAWVQDTNTNFYHKNVNEAYGTATMVHAEVVADYPGYYEMSAYVEEGNVDYHENRDGFDTVIRVRKDAVVNYIELGSDVRYVRYTLDEYTNRIPSDPYRKFSGARMTNVIYDTEGYIIEFSDSPAG